MIRIRPEGFEKVESVLRKMHASSSNMRPLMKKMGLLLIGTVDRNFEAEGRPDRWKPRSKLTLDAMANAAAGRASKTKRFQNAKRQSTRDNIIRSAALKAVGNKVLSGSGLLKKSIVCKVASDHVEVGPGGGVPYARIHQLGGVIRPKSGKYLCIPKAGGVIRVKSVTIPARPYLVIPPADMPGYALAACDYLRGLTND